jgi:aflatoxin B1 aldehyde reductase
MLRLTLQKSLAELRMHKLHVYYVGPDRSVPQSDIFRGISAVHQEGLFAQLGLTNLTAWKVAQICELCDREGWFKPSVYQGKYTALYCAVEPELFPCLRHYGIKFYAFNPFAGSSWPAVSRMRETGMGAVETRSTLLRWSCWIRSLRSMD